MPRRDLDSETIFGGLMSGVLSPERSAALFRAKFEGARYYLPSRLAQTLRDSQYKDTTDLDCPAGRLLDLYCRVWGPWEAVVAFTLHDLPLVECFLTAKLRDSLDEFTDEDLDTFDRVMWNKPINAEVKKAQARKLIPIADLLIRNPPDLN